MPASVKRTTRCNGSQMVGTLSRASRTDLRRLPAVEVQSLQSSGSVGLQTPCRVLVQYWTMDMSSKMRDQRE
ncbi:uncharacterized protein PITG_02083 [Phytophthora infestans T30-4]|uniref:Uncharacterized protein n=1 Tax=Phytophthora infestans (strain T30-4) TaxID=403677 RepID=D0MVF5_PHYIT|nr:uncharacterized protein PITG_02083 [Phytophthora infestans T30-4]EEY63618.1 hypothetical protein PITG_02083 [Phytophthora infestans T30-4]|eukprot:XP_002907054.1 hypothetical protein PITG_02083 [Phytophthora infestans T30-4]